MKNLIKKILRRFEIEIFYEDLINDNFINEVNKKKKLLNTFINLLNKIFDKKIFLLKITAIEAQKFQPLIYKKNPKANNLISLKNENVKKNFIVVAGFGSSGSSSVVDYLNEFQNVFLLQANDNPSEFRLIKDQGGLYDFYNQLRNHNNYWNNNFYRRNFINLAKIMNRKTKNAFFKFLWSNKEKKIIGFDYSSITNNQFMNFINQYINDIFFYKKIFCWYNDYVNLSCTETILRNLRINMNLEEKNFLLFSEISNEDLLNKTKFFLRKLFIEVMEFKNIEKNWHIGENFSNYSLIINQGIPPMFADNYLKIFPDNSKLIVVDRDPRDIYISNFENKFWPEEVEIFCKIFKLERESFKHQKNKNIFFIQFENWINNNAPISNELLKFLDLDVTNRSHLKNYYNSFEFSKSRIKKWKSKEYLPKFKIFDKIEALLPEYCVD
jgi:hypothetical protein